MKLDAIILADSGSYSYSVSNPLKLTIEGRVADIQVVKNYLEHGGKLKFPIEGDGKMSWASSKKLNGLVLLDHLKNNSFNVELIDNFDEQRQVFKSLLTKDPYCIVISTTFIGNKLALNQLVSNIRYLAPNIPIIVGGPFIFMSYILYQRMRELDYETTLSKRDFLFLDYTEEPDADLFIVSLRGEETLVRAINRIKNNTSYRDLPNCAYRKKGSYYFTPQIEELTQRHNGLIDWSNMRDSVFERGVVPMQASIGCPYTCTFCNFVKDRRHTSIKPLDHLVSELKIVKMKGAQYVWFVDDNFRLGKDDLNKVCQRFIAEDLGLKWMTFVRADALKRVDPNLLRKAGCYEVQLGLESADVQVLKNMNKNATPELYHDVLNRLLSSGINCSCYFIMGFPGETVESVQRTRSFIIDHQMPECEGSLSWSIFPFILSPLSPIYEPKMRQRYNLTGYMEKWRHSTMDAKQAYEQVVKTIKGIDSSGPIYRGDNLDMLEALGFKKRKSFYAIRHRLSKAAIQNQLNEKEIYWSFQSVFK
jgi:p-methyltransferase